MEETVYFQGGKTHPYLEHSFQFAGLLHVSFLFAQKSKAEVGEDSEGLPMRGRCS